MTDCAHRQAGRLRLREWPVTSQPLRMQEVAVTDCVDKITLCQRTHLWYLLLNCWLLLLTGILFGVSGYTSLCAAPPNVILIVCDNLGYGDIQVTNPQAKQSTPRLLQLAARGTVFSHAYSASPVCTSSRAALMTGCYPRRIGLDRTPSLPGHVLTPVSPYGLNPEELTIAEVLRPLGYRGICIGKWHLGDQLVFLPKQQGFDEFFGIPYSDDMVGTADGRRPPLPLMEGDQVVEAPVEVNTLSRRCTDRALQFIDQNRHHPFFLYFPLITPGSTASPPVHPDFRGQSPNGAWGDSILEIDWSLGQIVDKLEQLELTENTLILWTNDNGAPQQRVRGGSSEPLKGEAYSISEGGMRMPLIASWPGHIPQGANCKEVVSLMDIKPTVTAFAGGAVPAQPAIDGYDISRLLLGQPPAASPYEAFFYWYLDQLQAVRAGPWKMYLGGQRLTGFGKQTRLESAELYHLEQDPRETRNVIAQHPEVVMQLNRYVDRHLAAMGEGEHRGPACRSVGISENPTPRLIAK